MPPCAAIVPHAGKRPGHLANLELGRVAAEVRHCLRGLAARSFARGDRLAIIGDNRPRLYWSMAAAQCLGGVPVPLYQDAVAEEMVFVLQDAGALCRGGGSGAGGQAPGNPRPPADAHHIIYDDPRGMRHYQHDGLHSFAEVLGDGRVHPTSIRIFQSEVDGVGADDIAIMLYTSGTTGNPKGVAHTYHSMIVAAATASRRKG